MPRGIPKAPLEERFLRRVEKTDSCWIWKGARYTTGYGELKENTWGDVYTHRWSFKHFHKKDIPEGMDVRHKCDNRTCVNPAHLELGTRKQNVDDMLERYQGNPCNRKFSKEEVEQIKKMREEGMIYKEIAAKFDCSRRTIEKLCLGKTYQK